MAGKTGLSVGGSRRSPTGSRRTILCAGRRGFERNWTFAPGLDKRRNPLIFSRMEHYEFHKRLKAIHEKAVAKYAAGEREADAYFDESETAFLQSIGATPVEMYDFAEDWVSEREPDWESFLLIQTIRRDFFLLEQGGEPSGNRLPMSDYPEKDDEADGIPWLPRLILKAKSKLRGEMPVDLMYCCGGDRDFFRTHDIHPSEFLHLTWRNIDNDRTIIDWVLQRSGK